MVYSIPAFVEREVESPERFDARVQRPSHVVASRHVALDGERIAADFADHVRCFLIALFRHVRDGHARALAGECQRRRTANAVRRAGHECDFPFELVQ
jgi:hypothetical protein